MDYDWPGNVRELENVIERGVVLTTGPQIGRELIPDHVRTAPSFHVPHLTVPPEGISLRDVIANFERRLIESTLESTGGRAEGGGAPARPQAHHPERDDQAAQHPAPARARPRAAATDLDEAAGRHPTETRRREPRCTALLTRAPIVAHLVASSLTFSRRHIWHHRELAEGRTRQSLNPWPSKAHSLSFISPTSSSSSASAGRPASST